MRAQWAVGQQQPWTSHMSFPVRVTCWVICWTWTWVLQSMCPRSPPCRWVRWTFWEEALTVWWAWAYLCTLTLLNLGKDPLSDCTLLSLQQWVLRVWHIVWNNNRRLYCIQALTPIRSFYSLPVLVTWCYLVVITIHFNDSSITLRRKEAVQAVVKHLESWNFPKRNGYMMKS